MNTELCMRLFRSTQMAVLGLAFFGNLAALCQSQTPTQYLVAPITGGARCRIVQGLGSLYGGLTVDSLGNIFFGTDNCVFKLNGAGVLSVAAGRSPSPGYGGDGGWATKALLNEPVE